MKSLSFLFFILFIILGCEDTNIKTNTERDTVFKDHAKGVQRIKRELKAKDNSELIKTLQDNCSDYLDSTGFSLFPNSPLQTVRNCLAKTIDQGLKPICENKKILEEAKDYYLDKGDDKKVEEIEELLQNNEELIYDSTNYIYGLADEFDNFHSDLTDEIDKEIEGTSQLEKLVLSTTNLFLNSEIGSLTKTVDIKARQACSQVDFNKIRKRRKKY